MYELLYFDLKVCTAIIINKYITDTQCKLWIGVVRFQFVSHFSKNNLACKLKIGYNLLSLE